MMLYSHGLCVFSTSTVV